MKGQLEFESWQVPKAIKIARIIAGLTQEQLARRAGIVSQNMVSRFETSEIDPKSIDLASLFDACGYELTYKLTPKES
jgi:transcriptional regulator with XRE-family HTH domain